MNIAYFLIPKHSVATSTTTTPSARAWKKCTITATPAIPVIARDGRYIGTVSEGDFLWRLLDEGIETKAPCSMKALEHLEIRDILRGNNYPPVRITVTMEELLNSAMNQNFIPVVDDSDSFIGIVTRKDIIRYFSNQRTSMEPALLRKIV